MPPFASASAPAMHAFRPMRGSSGMACPWTGPTSPSSQPSRGGHESDSMSGLVAILNRAGQPADSSLLTRMLAAAPHRGPDGFGGWFEGPVALGSAQLHSTPESLGERQPLSDKAAETWIVCDGRLDNRAELMAALGDALPDPETASDAACIAAAYGRWGEGCPSRLLGDFAFAIWDRRRRHLFCARDLVGIRPLYYRLTETSFYAASETRQLLNVPDAALRPNVGMMAEYLSGRLLSVEETLHDGILRLPAGHSLTVTSETIRVRRYDEIKLTRIRLRNDQEYAEAFLSHFREAVACRMRSHTAIGVTVSGGLDSSSVFGMACRLAGDQPGV